MRLPRLLTGLLALGLVATVVVACGSTTPKATAPTTTSPTTASSGSGGGGSGGSTITISNYTFNPKTLTVAPGAKITVHNTDNVTHTVTANGTAKGKFDTGDIAGGATTTFTAPSTAGQYPYMCTIHPFMTATLVVS
ncbi:MAG: cupredoxin domain-containing protein [Acidimicrobiales bacterium]